MTICIFGLSTQWDITAKQGYKCGLFRIYIILTFAVFLNWNGTLVFDAIELAMKYCVVAWLPY